MYTNAHSGTIYSSQGMEAAQGPINRQVDKKAVYVQNGILLSHKTEWKMSFATTWMDLESITLSEVTQTKKDKNCMLPLMDGI